MSSNIEQQYRTFLFVLSALAFIGAMVELAFLEHFESALQLVPFVLGGAGLIAVLATWLVQNPGIIRAHQVIMVLVVVGGSFGVYEHLTHNFAFELEIRPNAIATDVIWEALHGASPLMAPGIFSFGGILGLAAVFRHPALK